MSTSRTALVACLLVGMSVEPTALAGGAELGLRLGETAYVGGSSGASFVGLFIENRSSVVVFVDLAQLAKSVSVAAAGEERGRATSQARDANHGAQLCAGLGDVVAIEPGKSVTALAKVPEGMAPGRVTLKVRVQAPMKLAPELCGAWPKKGLETSATVLIPDRPRRGAGQAP